MSREKDDLQSRIERAKQYGYRIELKSERIETGRWGPAAIVWIDEGGSTTSHPISSGKMLTFPTKQEADAHALELALSLAERKY